MHYVTHISLHDGFGSQFQHIISVLLICYHNGWDFIYNPIKKMDHNYDNDPGFIDKIENLMNIKKFHKSRTELEAAQNPHITECDMTAKYVIDKDPDQYATEESLNRIRTMFWENKDRSVFRDNGKVNVAIHIRRPNSCDLDLGGLPRYSPDHVFLKNIQHIRDTHPANAYPLQFHIFSQGEMELFECYRAEDTVFHINEPLDTTFVSLVAADILVTCASSLSYAAALLNAGTVYYYPFWHSKRSSWITMETD